MLLSKYGLPPEKKIVLSRFWGRSELSKMRLNRFCSFCRLLLRFPPAISPQYAVFIFFELNIATAFLPAEITYTSSQTDRAPFFNFVFFSSSVRVCNRGIEVMFPFNLRVLDLNAVMRKEPLIMKHLNYG